MSEQGITRKLAAILAADIVSYSRLMNENEDETIRAWRAARVEVIDPHVGSYDGRIVKHTGDGFLAEFNTVADAVRCALDMQNELSARAETQAPNRRLDFRMGINLGDIVIEADDIQGDGVNIAARLEGLAEPGGICISGDVYRQVKNKLDLGYRALGEKHIKNIAEPIVAYLIPPQGSTVPPWAKPPIDEPDEYEPAPPAWQPAFDGGPEPGEPVSECRRVSAILLYLILGIFGGHRFYLGYRAKAWVQLFTIGGLGLWMLGDLILLLTGELRDGQGRKIRRWI